MKIKSKAIDKCVKEIRDRSEFPSTLRLLIKQLQDQFYDYFEIGTEGWLPSYEEAKQEMVKDTEAAIVRLLKFIGNQNNIDALIQCFDIMYDAAFEILKEGWVAKGGMFNEWAGEPWEAAEEIVKILSSELYRESWSELGEG